MSLGKHAMYTNTTPRISAGRPADGSGFSLLEVLIALVVLSVGLLGIAAMISTSLKANDSAYMRSQATDLAYNMIDRMRVNRSIALASGYDIAIGLPGVATSASALSACITASCNTTALAAFDLSQWKNDLGTLLPSGTGSIGPTVVAGGVATVTVTVQWSDTRAQTGLGGAATPYKLSITTSL